MNIIIVTTIIRQIHTLSERSETLLVDFQCVAQGHKADFQYDSFMGILQRGFFPRKASDIQSGSQLFKTELVNSSDTAVILEFRLY